MLNSNDTSLQQSYSELNKKLNKMNRDKSKNGNLLTPKSVNSTKTTYS